MGAFAVVVVVVDVANAVGSDICGFGLGTFLSPYSSGRLALFFSLPKETVAPNC